MITCTDKFRKAWTKLFGSLNNIKNTVNFLDYQTDKGMYDENDIYIIYYMKPFLKADNKNYLQKSIINKYSYKLSFPTFVTKYTTFKYTWLKLEYQPVFEQFLSKEKAMKVVVWPSDKIRYAYFHKNYWRIKGNIGNSCMRKKTNQKALNFYIKNNVKIAVILDENNKVKARALLWDNVKIPNKKSNKKSIITYLDRIYTSEEKQYKIYEKFAKKNKYKSYNWTSSNYMILDNIDIKNIIYLPYTDTFKYLYYKKGILSSKLIETEQTPLVTLSIQNNRGYFWELDPNCVIEVITRNRISKKDGVFVKKYEGYVSKDNIVEIDTEYFSKKDKNIVLFNNKTWCLKKDVIVELFTGDFIKRKNSIQIKKYEGYISKDNIIKIKGEQYHKKDADIICYADTYYLKKDCYYSNTHGYIPQYNKYIVYDIREIDSYPIEYELIINRKNNIYKIIKYPSLIFAEYVPDILLDKYYIKLNTGEFVKNTKENKKYLIHRNNKTYLKHLYKSKNATEKNQLKFSFSEML